MMQATILLLLLVILAVWLYRDNTAVMTTRINVKSPDLPGNFASFVLVQVSDLHNTEFGNQQKKLLSAIAAAAPDLIAVTGDLLDSRRTDTEKALAFIEGALKIAPVYYVTGNHESRIDTFPQFEAALTAKGVSVLRNEGTTIKQGDSRIRLIGLDDPTFSMDHQTIKNSGIIDKTLGDLEREDGIYTILLCHRPELFDVYAGHGIDLALCGHAHGGQVRLPLLGGIYAPNQGLWPKYQSGLYTKGKTNMVVSRGLGNSLDPVRVHNRPELVAVTLSQQQ